MKKKYSIYQNDVLKKLITVPDDSVDGVITDPPFSSGSTFACNRQQQTSKKYLRGYNNRFPDFHGDNKDQRSFGFWMILWLLECFRVLKDDTPICIFTDWRQLPLMSDALQAAGFLWRGVYVWDKKNSRPIKGRFRQQTEFVIWGSKGELPFSRSKEVGYLSGITSEAIPDITKREHQTQKPRELMENIVKIVKPKGVVLDPFMGSGSTGVAALNLGRQFIGIEYNKHYFDVSKKRLQQLSI